MSTIACSYISPIAYQVRISYRLASTRYIPGTSTSTRLSISMSISISISTSTVSYRLPGTFISTTRYLHIDYQVPSYRLPYQVSHIANRLSLVAQRLLLFAYRQPPVCRPALSALRVLCCRAGGAPHGRHALPAHAEHAGLGGTVRYGTVEYS